MGTGADREFPDSEEMKRDLMKSLCLQKLAHLQKREVDVLAHFERAIAAVNPRDELTRERMTVLFQKVMKELQDTRARTLEKLAQLTGAGDAHPPTGTGQPHHRHSPAKWAPRRHGSAAA